jgi:hypothetical protein
VSPDSPPSAPVTRTQANLIALAEACSRVRRDVGALFMAPEGSAQRDGAEAHLRESLRRLLEEAREEDTGLFLEVAAQMD